MFDTETQSLCRMASSPDVIRGSVPVEMDLQRSDDKLWPINVRWEVDSPQSSVSVCWHHRGSRQEHELLQALESCPEGLYRSHCSITGANDEKAPCNSQATDLQARRRGPHQYFSSFPLYCIYTYVDDRPHHTSNLPSPRQRRVVGNELLLLTRVSTRYSLTQSQNYFIGQGLEARHSGSALQYFIKAGEPRVATSHYCYYCYYQLHKRLGVRREEATHSKQEHEESD